MRLDAPLRFGEVALVGAGPGDVSLLTLAAAHLIQHCDVIIYDALVSPETLALIPDSCERYDAGKRGGRQSADQQDICQTMILLSRAGHRVVRLKGGDSFVFGRGGEEIRALADAEVPFRVIPGITSGLAAPALAGIPVTDREVNATLAFLTGHEALATSRIDWQSLVKTFPVLVIYMGAKNLSAIACKLLEAGMDEDTPVAVLHAVSCSHERQDFGILREAADGELQGTSPAIIVVGKTVALRQPWRALLK